MKDIFLLKFNKKIIKLLPDKYYCWTIFIPGKRSRDWGFKTEKGWINQEQYLIEKSKNV